LLTHFDAKFAIRPSIRNNKELTRDAVIKTVAAIVGPGHKVDLHGYDLLILVEIYKVCFRFVRSCVLVAPCTPILTAADMRQNVVGMSVVGPDFEKLKRFNLEELRQIPAAEHAPSPKPVKNDSEE
jgi:tRNA acetyltransferase TAN1